MKPPTDSAGAPKVQIIGGLPGLRNRMGESRQETPAPCNRRPTPFGARTPPRERFEAKFFRVPRHREALSKYGSMGIPLLMIGEWQFVPSLPKTCFTLYRLARTAAAGATN